MANSLRHRGPDDSGVWVDPDSGIALGHRRLSIVDLSVEGHQPMRSVTGRYTIVFNGEIYNFRDLRLKLENVCAFRGYSDTEVLLAAFEEWGIERALKSTVGMFALALWDAKEQVLTLARDRAGEKPLYYGWSGKALVFGSELKALRAYNDWKGTVDRDALSAFFYMGYIPAPYSIYKGIKKLPPGTAVQFRARRDAPGDFPEPVSYWSMRASVREGASSRFRGTEEEAVNELERLLKQSISRQMVADVPVGAFLSGGIDSSTVVALMQAQSDRPVRTFTIGFNEAQYNEAQHAAAIARHLGTEHTELYVRPSEAMAVIPQLPATYDEPFSDSSQVPTMLVSQLARRSVTVSLSGDGGDELFAGYPRYGFTSDVWKKMRLVPSPLRKTAASVIKHIPVSLLNRSFGWVFRLRGQAVQGAKFGDRVHKGANLLALRNADELYWKLYSHWSDSEPLVVGGTSRALDSVFEERRVGDASLMERMCFADSVSYLPDDILVKVDRASMAVSLESRVPLLDHEVIEFAWRVPVNLKIRKGVGKWILRQVLYRYVPQALVDRPKMGFGVPIDEWLRSPLRDWAEDLLSESRLKREGFLNPRPIRIKWEEHLSGQRRWHYYIWSVLMFQAWLESQDDTVKVA